MKILKVEVTIGITDEILRQHQQELGYDAMVNWIYEGEMYDGYKVLEISKPIEYTMIQSKHES
jgi:hypothetical protein|tara:strand:- start:227 stop:415 length:189 start_codon:yes stop_codon:yes gene_type:complete